MNYSAASSCAAGVVCVCALYGRERAVIAIYTFALEGNGKSELSLCAKSAMKRVDNLPRSALYNF